jgi:hypothetical protein
VKLEKLTFLIEAASSIAAVITMIYLARQVLP